jgi:bacterioferritin-associated ferredoxin
MIVCLCRGVSDRDVCDAVREGARSPEDIARSCGGAGTDCGSCRPDIEAVLEAATSDRAA